MPQGLCLNMCISDWDLQVYCLLTKAGEQILSDNSLETPKKDLAFQNIWSVMNNFGCTCMVDDIIVCAGN